MVEEDVANYIASNSDFAVGTDIFLGTLPSGTREGMIVRNVRELEAFSALNLAYISIVLFYRSYSTAAESQATVSDLLNNRRGTLDGTWCVASDKVEREDLGIDTLNRYVKSVSCIVGYSE
ncbi:MAG TPA: hypothetical protein EYP19_11740 [Desulfobacterales bacterium]|nr:hypothetical protein [Desulfobacterales bacterium]